MSLITHCKNGDFGKALFQLAEYHVHNLAIRSGSWRGGCYSVKSIGIVCTNSDDDYRRF